MSHSSSKPKADPINPTPRSANPTPFILPLVAFLVIANFYPDFAASYEFEDSERPAITPETWRYLVMVGLQVLVATGLLIYFRKVYLEHFPLRFSPLSIVVGVVGVVLWIAICHFRLEPQVLGMLGFNADRPSFNPNTLDDRLVRNLFLVLRFTLLALIVPIIEELFLRGWLIRWVENPEWENVSLGQLSLGALLSASLYGVLAHPSEAIAAFLWFGLVTLLMKRTGNLWDCVVAHAVTNLLLGVYILTYEQWQLW